MIEGLKQVLTSLDRSVFHSEADFQHALAWKIKEKFKDAKIRLEKPFNVDGKVFYIDIFIEINNKKLGIELKYKTKKLNKLIKDEEYNLKDQGARDLGRYDFCKDIFRIERFIEKGYIDWGLVILLTNDKGYQTGNGSKKQSKETIDSQFRLPHGKKLEGNMIWNRTPKWTNGRGEILLKGNYDISWREHDKDHGFDILIIEIKKDFRVSLSKRKGEVGDD